MNIKILKIFSTNQNEDIEDIKDIKKWTLNLIQPHKIDL